PPGPGDLLRGGARAKGGTRQAARAAACREHGGVAARSPRAGADHQRDPQGAHAAVRLMTRASTARVSPPSRARLTTPNVAAAQPQAITARHPFSRKPDTGSAPA